MKETDTGADQTKVETNRVGDWVSKSYLEEVRHARHMG